MAKKRKKRHPSARPATGAPASAGESAGARSERKEAARREREERVRRARRRVMLRRLSRIGIVIVIAAAIAGFVWFQGAADRRLASAAAEAADRLSCSEIEDVPDEGREHITAQDPPPDYGSSPATSGPHRGDATLQRDLPVYDDPIDPVLEAQAVHNLEHGYILLYYRQDGAGALPEPVVDALAGYARGEADGEGKVIVAPYPTLPEGTSLALAAWNKLQTCPEVSSEDDVLAMVKGFVAQFRSGGEAPEPNAV